MDKFCKNLVRVIIILVALGFNIMLWTSCSYPKDDGQPTDQLELPRVDPTEVEDYLSSKGLLQGQVEFVMGLIMVATDSLTDDVAFEYNDFYGKINKDGSYISYPSWQTSVDSLLVDLRREGCFAE